MNYPEKRKPNRNGHIRKICMNSNINTSILAHDKTFESVLIFTFNFRDYEINSWQKHIVIIYFLKISNNTMVILETKTYSS